MAGLRYSGRWNSYSYQVHFLRSGGLVKADFADIVQLGDTVHLGSTGGLFKRPLNKLFEPAPKP